MKCEEIQMSDKSSIVAVYDTHMDAEIGVKELQKAGFDMTRLSVVGREYHTGEYIVGYYNSGYRMQYWGKMGTFWSGLWGFLAGAAFFVLPGMGPILIAGPLAGAVVAELEKSVVKGADVTGGLSALGAGLFSLAIPKDRVFYYETSLMADKFLLIAHGAAKELVKAKTVLRITRPRELNLHFTEQTVLAHS
jgi:hypothetical protein